MNLTAKYLTTCLVRASFVACIFIVAPQDLMAGALEAEAAFQAKNYTEAYKEWMALAQKGDAIAQFNVGFLYSRELGVPLDYSKAAEWWDKAADQDMAV